jgi:ABC-type multidrug transport system fused ATPase/permease subunit
VVLELRRRLFAHVMRLPVSFHESYTSGRMISRQTSDVDAISELFNEGLDGLPGSVDVCVPAPTEPKPAGSRSPTASRRTRCLPSFGAPGRRVSRRRR